MRDSRSGFTLIELLVVMAILAALGGIAALGVPRWLRAADRSAVETTLHLLDAQVQAYAQNPRNGDFPPTVLERDDFPGVGHLSNLDNCGIESLVLCLNRRGQTSSFDVESLKGAELRNDDEDRTQVPLTSFGDDNRELFELVDRWGMPLAYFHHRDYDIIDTKNLGTVLGLEGPVKARPWRNPTTKAWFNRTSFQIISAGPDGEFNTDDDITNFERN